jgi:hypothetical protein
MPAFKQGNWVSSKKLAPVVAPVVASITCHFCCHFRMQAAAAFHEIYLHSTPQSA